MRSLRRSVKYPFDTGRKLRQCIGGRFMQYQGNEAQLKGWNEADAAKTLEETQLIVGMAAAVMILLAVVLSLLFSAWITEGIRAEELRAVSSVILGRAAENERQIDFLQLELGEYEVVMKKLSGYSGHASYRSPIAGRGGSEGYQNTYTGHNGSKLPAFDGIISVGGKKLQYVGDWELTAYNPTVGQCDSDPWTTASGARTNPGLTCAIDRRYWKFGTRFWVSGFGEVVAQDTGSKVLGEKRMDICMMDVKMARTLGRWRARVYVIIND